MLTKSSDMREAKTPRVQKKGEAKKNQRPLSELFTGNTAKKIANALAKVP